MKRIVLYVSAVVSFSAAFVYLLHDPVNGRVAPALASARGDVAVSSSGGRIPSAAVRSEDAHAPVDSVDREPHGPAQDVSGQAATEPDAARKGVDFEAIKQRHGVTYDPMLVMGLGDFTDEEIDAYNELHVLPFNPAVGNDCQELPDPQFTDRFHKTCKTVRERAEHPYHDLAESELRYLAMHDAAAALVLGRRSVGEEERLYWYLRAAALSEKSGPLMALAERRYGSAHKLQTVDGRVVPVPQPDAMVKRLALETVASKLGDPRARPERWRESLLRVSGEQSKGAVQRADALVVEILDYMADAQRRVTGSVQVQEIIDA